jgi:hypothetical protein
MPIHELLALKGSGKEVGLEFSILDTLPNPLDKLGTESAVTFVNSHDLTDHVAIVNTIEVQALNNITYLHHLLRYLTV